MNEPERKYCETCGAPLRFQYSGSFDPYDGKPMNQKVCSKAPCHTDERLHRPCNHCVICGSVMEDDAFVVCVSCCDDPDSEWLSSTIKALIKNIEDSKEIINMGNQPKVGAFIRVFTGSVPFYSAGDLARLTRQNEDLWWADFNDQGNDHVYKEGVWCVGTTDDFEVIDINNVNAHPRKENPVFIDTIKLEELEEENKRLKQFKTLCEQRREHIADLVEENRKLRNQVIAKGCKIKNGPAASARRRINNSAAMKQNKELHSLCETRKAHIIDSMKEKKKLQNQVAEQEKEIQAVKTLCSQYRSHIDDVRKFAWDVASSRSMRPLDALFMIASRIPKIKIPKDTKRY